MLNEESRNSENQFAKNLTVTRCKMLNEEALRVLETLDGWVQPLPLHISRQLLHVRSHTFQSRNPFEQFSGSHWGRISLRPRSKGRVWRARKVPLFANHPVSCILNTLSCDFYLKLFISYLASLSGDFYLISLSVNIG